MNFALIVSGNGGFAKALYKNLHLIKNGNLAVIIADRNCGAFNYFNDNTKIPTYLINYYNYKSKKDFEEAILFKLLENNIEFIFLNYDRLIGDVLLKAYNNRIFNLHLSLLPLFKGFKAVEKAYNSGMLFYGATVHIVDHSIDGGPIIGQVVIAKNPNDDIISFNQRIFEHAVILMIDHIYKIVNHQSEGRFYYLNANYNQYKYNPQLSIDENLIITKID